MKDEAFVRPCAPSLLWDTRGPQGCSGQIYALGVWGAWGPFVRPLCVDCLSHSWLGPRRPARTPPPGPHHHQRRAQQTSQDAHGRHRQRLFGDVRDVQALGYPAPAWPPSVAAQCILASMERGGRWCVGFRGDPNGVQSLRPVVNKDPSQSSVRRAPYPPALRLGRADLQPNLSPSVLALRR